MGAVLLLVDAIGIVDCIVDAGTAGGGGIVPTNGDDIIGGTIGIILGALGGTAVVVLAPIIAGFVIC